MTKLKELIKSKAAWATVAAVAGVTYGVAGSAIVGALQTIACTVQTCV